MSTYGIGAYEALGWTWNVLRVQKNMGKQMLLLIQGDIGPVRGENPVDYKHIQ
jgi:hypothetical protein